MREPLPQGANSQSVDLDCVSLSYGETSAIDSLTLHVEPGEFLSLLGPSGSGKTSTLKLIGGFERPTSGRVLVGGNDVGALPAHRRNIGVVFQDYLLFPHMTAEQNLAFPLRERKVPREEIRSRVAEALHLVNLDGFGQRYPKQLSGGQQQRVALARALVFNPPVLLMDEPLGALDKNIRQSLQLEFRRIHRELGVTVIYVTHDQDEALTLSDRIALYDGGRISQLGTPDELYERPVNRFVAEFLGESNCFTGNAGRNAKRWELDGGSFRVIVSGPPNSGADSGGPATLIVRPERMHLARPGESMKDNVLAARVHESIYLGSGRRLELEVPGLSPLVVHSRGREFDGFSVGDDLEVGWDVSDSWLLPETEDPGHSSDVLSLGGGASGRLGGDLRRDITTDVSHTQGVTSTQIVS